MRIALEGITKRFPDGTLALNEVSFDLAAGEIHGLLGENGAGKTTLMNILFGLHQPTAGRIVANGRAAVIGAPGDAIRLGIGMVHQHFMLAYGLTVLENIVAGTRTEGSRGATRGRILELAKRYGLELDLDARVSQLPVGVQQRLEILKALYRGVRVLVLDEPTAVLTPPEAVKLSETMKQLRDGGHSLVFISHKLGEVMSTCDRVTVLRDGQLVGTVPIAESTSSSLAHMMVGRPIRMPTNPGTGEDVTPRSVLRVDDLRVKGDRGEDAVRGISFDIKAGEIFGIAGVDGNGQRELVEAVMGLRRKVAGRVQLAETDVSTQPVGNLIRRGIRLIPEDRHGSALVFGFSVADNLVLTHHDQAPYCRWGLRDFPAIQDFARRAITEFSIKTQSPHSNIGRLSGGNQQKVVLARALEGDVRLIIAMQPTRGLDIAATEFVRRRLLEEKAKGRALLLVSTELEEVLTLSDRVAVIYGGRFQGVFRRGQLDLQEVGLLMSGSPVPKEAVNS